MARTVRSWVQVGVAWSRVEPERGGYDPGELSRLSREVRDARQAGREPVVVLHRGALPDWTIARGGWLDPDVLAGFGCYVDRVAQALGVHVGYYLSFDGLLAEAEWYGRDAPRVARTLVEAHAAAYLHLRRSSGHGARPPEVGVAERDDPAVAPVGALLRVLATGRWHRPFGWLGELPNGTPCLDFVAAASPSLLPLLVPLGRPALLLGVDPAEAQRLGVRVLGVG